MMQITQNPSSVVYGESVILTETTVPNKFTPTIAGATVETFSKTGTDLSASNWKGSTTQINGIIGKGASFNGTTDYITADSLPTLTTQGTISLWVRQLSGNVIYSQGNNNYGSFDIAIENTQLKLGNGFSQCLFLYANAFIYEWNHIVVTFNISSGSEVSDNVKLYVNGSRITMTFSGTSITSIGGHSDKYIGICFINSLPYYGIVGSICNLLVTTDVLTDSQILQLATLPSVLDERRDVYIPEDYEFLETFTKPDVYNTPLTDSRDGEVYKTVNIGTQTWMAENFRGDFGTNFDVNKEPLNRAILGRLYPADQAISNAPTGWHLPSASEFAELVAFVGGESFGGKLENAEFVGGTDEYGFNIRKTGFYDSGYGGDIIGLDNGFLCASNNSYPYYDALVFMNGTATYSPNYLLTNYNGRTFYAPVRYIKDAYEPLISTDAPATVIDGTYTGSGWASTTEQRNFPIGNCAYNNGVRRYNPNSWLLNRDYSVCCWFKINSQWNPTYGTPVLLWGTDKGAVGSAGGLLCYFSYYSTGLVDYNTITILTHRGDSYAFPTSTTYRVPDSVDITKWHSFVYTGDDVTINNTNGNVYIDGMLLSVTQPYTEGREIGIGTQAKNISFGDNKVSVALAALYYRKLIYSEVLAWANKIYEKQIGNGSYTPYRPAGAVTESFSRTGSDAPESDWNYTYAGGIQKKYDTFNSSVSSLVKRTDMGLVARDSLVNNNKLTYSFWIKYSTSTQSSTDAVCYDTFLIASDGTNRYWSGLNLNTMRYYIWGTGGGQTNAVSYDLSTLGIEAGTWVHVAVHIPNILTLYLNGCELYINGTKSTTMYSIQHYGWLPEPVYSEITFIRIGGYPDVNRIYCGACEIAEYNVMPASYSFVESDFISASKTPPTANKLLTTSNSLSYLVPSAALLRLKEAEVSMLCIDGTDGKGNAVQLHPIFSAYNIKTITWTSSDITKATVGSTGIVTGFSAGDVTITCTCNGISKSCLFTIFDTLPDDTTLYTLKGGSGGNSNDSIVTGYTLFKTTQSLSQMTTQSVRVKSKSYTGTSYTQTVGFNNTNGMAPIEYVAAALHRHDIRTQISDTEYRDDYFGDYLNNSTKYDFDISKSSEGFKSSGSIFSLYSTSTSTIPSVNEYLLVFSNLLEKCVLSSASSANITEAQLGIKDNCELFFIPQNYIRYSDHDGITNPTKILNIGTLGNKLDLYADNVPSLWFGV